MKRIVISLVAAMLGTGPLVTALAADKGGPEIAVPNAPGIGPVTSPSAWTGPYVEGGFDARVISDRASGLGVTQPNGLLLGFGYDREISPSVVVGVLARYGVTTNIGGTSGPLLVKFDRPWMVAARAGYLLSQSTLAYGVGGFTAGDIVAANASRMYRRGVVLGGGLETQVPYVNHATFGLEYLWSNLGDHDIDSRQVSLLFKYRF